MTNMPSTIYPLSFSLRLVPGVTMLFPHGDLPQRLATARAHGFTGVEGSVPDDAAGLRKLLDDNGMQFVCMSLARGSTPEESFGIGALPGRQSEFREALLRGIETAVSLSCPMIHPLGGLVPDGQREACRNIYLESIGLACEEAARAGMRVLMEPICAVRQPRYILNRHAEAISVIEAIRAPNLKVMADMFHAHMGGESMVDFAAAHADAIGLLQVSDPSNRIPPLPTENQLQGTIDALVAQRWKGWVSAEYVTTGTDSESLRWTGLLAPGRVAAA